MKTLKLFGRTVSIDIEKLSKGLCELHEQDEEMKTILAFGMLDANLCKMFENYLGIQIREQFSKDINELYKAEIEKFISDCNNEVTKGVYSYAKMVV